MREERSPFIRHLLPSFLAAFPFCPHLHLNDHLYPSLLPLSPSLFLPKHSHLSKINCSSRITLPPRPTPNPPCTHTHTHTDTHTHARTRTHTHGESDGDRGWCVSQRQIEEGEWSIEGAERMDGLLIKLITLF